MDTTSTVVPYFLYSSGILLREGLEALLVIIALVAGTREAGQESRARDIYAGGLLAVGVSIALAWAVAEIVARIPLGRMPRIPAHARPAQEATAPT